MLYNVSISLLNQYRAKDNKNKYILLKEYRGRRKMKKGGLIRSEKDIVIYKWQESIRCIEEQPTTSKKLKKKYREKKKEKNR